MSACVSPWRRSVCHTAARQMNRWYPYCCQHDTTCAGRSVTTARLPASGGMPAAKASLIFARRSLHSRSFRSGGPPTSRASELRCTQKFAAL
ncbi:hypothetical protein DIPPA_34206 [Diplonema papillatum]|nr:hypothetical protein DIPPA_34206 [Diplonema papillatum]